ncbi:hypothetical protein BH09MYX1_BH09MYX1_25890 [soil metagenome]
MRTSSPPELTQTLERHGLGAHAAAADELKLEGEPADDDLGELLRIAAAAATDARRYATLLRDVLAALRARQEDLSAEGRGRFFHLAGFFALRVDEDVALALRHLNRARDTLAPLVEKSARSYLARVHDTLGQLLHREGQWDSAQKELARSLALRRETGDVVGLAITLGNLGRLCLDIGNIAAAEAHFLEDLALLAEGDVGPRRDRLRAQLLVHLGDCAVETGRTELARERFARAIASADASGDRFARAFGCIGLGRVTKGARGEEWLASAEADLSAAEVPEAFTASPRAAIAHLRGANALDHGDAAVAIPFLESALRDLGAADAPVARARVLGTLARAQIRTGDPLRATESLRAALRIVDATSADLLREELEQALRELSRDAWLLHAAGRFVGQRSIELLLEDTGRAGFRGKRRDVCVLFSDIRGFTTFAEHTAPDEVVLFLNEFLGHMTRAIEREGGVVDKFIGDAVMALFGLTDATGEASGRPILGSSTLAVRAALAMREELARMNGSAHDLKLDVGFGVHRGPVVAGLIGSPQKRSYTVLGDVVNTSSRLEGMTKQLGAVLLVSHAVKDTLTPGEFVLRPLGSYVPKGKRDPIGVFEVLGEADGSPEALRHLAHAEDAGEALALLHGREMERAATRYHELALAYPRAAVGYELLARAAESFAITPPPTDWDGAISLASK